MNKETSKFYLDIVSRLNAVRKKEDKFFLYSGLMYTLFFIIVTIVGITLIEQFYSLSSPGRTILFYFASVIICAVSCWFIVRPLLYIFGILHSSDNHTIALKVGNRFPSIKDRLLDAIQIYENKQTLQQHYSLSLIDASFADLYEQIKDLNFTDTVSNAKLRRAAKYTMYSLILSMLLILISPSGFYGAMFRIIHFNKSFLPPAVLNFYIEPGNIEVVRGQNVPITITTQGKLVNSISFFTRQVGQHDFDTQTLQRSGDGTFKVIIKNIKSTTEYFAEADNIQSQKFVLTVFDRPLIRSLRIKVNPPSYTRLPSKELEDNVGDITGYPGSKIEMQVKSSKGLSSAKIYFNDSTITPLTISGNEAHAAFKIHKNLTYHLFLEDENKLTNTDPVEYTIKIIPDEYPTIEILSPGKNIDIAEEMKLDLLLRLKDDFGFSKVILAHRLVQSRYEKPQEEFTTENIPLTSSNQSQIDMWYHWDLSSLHLVPEDVVAYYVEVFDNDNISGPKSARSQIYFVRLPSLEEVFTDVSQSHQQSFESLQNISNEAQQLKKEIDELKNEIRKNKDKTDWQQKKKVEELSKRYDALKKKLDETVQRMDEMIKKMEENKILSNETIEKYAELQKLMEKLNAPELRDALKKLQESMKQLSPEQMKQAMEQLKFTEEQFRKSLERTIELLKRIHIEQKLDELIKRTEELIKQQETLKEKTSKADPSDQKKREELAKRQQDLQEQLDALQKETESLKEKMEEFAKEMPLDEISKASQQLQQNNTSQKMQNSRTQMQAGNMQGAQQQQQEVEKDLENFKKQLELAQKSLLDKQMQQIVNEMRRQLENILELSKREESLKEDTKKLEPNSPLFRQNAQEQNELMEDLNNIANAMSELSKKTFAVSPEMGKEIGNALKQMSEAIEQTELRNPSGTSQKQEQAMGSLNRAAMMMQGALSAMMKSGQSGLGMAGLMAQLQQMAGMQGNINSATQEAMSMGHGQGQQISAQQAAEYQRLANQQAVVQKSLEQLANEAKNAGEYSRLLGDLDRIAQEMKEVETDLQQGNVNPNTIQKQERILSRLLESARSMRERDYEKRRTAEAGKNILHPSPAEIDITTQEGKNKLREEMLKALQENYSKDYEELIKKYFEELEKENIKN